MVGERIQWERSVGGGLIGLVSVKEGAEEEIKEEEEEKTRDNR